MIRRYKWVDYGKGIIITLMVAGHVERAILSLLNTRIVQLLIFDRILYSFHMAVMFFLSGYLVNDLNIVKYDKEMYMSRIIKCMFKLYIPYLIWIYLYWFIKYFIYAGNEMVSISDLKVLWYTPRWNLWFLYALFVIQLLVLTIRCFTNNCYIIFSLFLGYYFLYIIYEKIQVSNKIELIGWLSYGVFYSYGMLIRGRNIKQFSKYVCISSILLILLAILLNYDDLYIECMLCAGLGISTLMYKLRAYIERFFSIFGIIGQYSLEIYICHFIVVRFFTKIIIDIGVSNIYIIWISGTFLCLLFPLMIVFMYTYINPLRWIQYMFHSYSLLINRKA